MTDPPRPSLGYEGLAITTPSATIIEIAIDDIDVPQEMRTIDDDTVQRIIESISEIGLQAQGVITVEWNPAGSPRRASLVAGRHRLEAFRLMGWSTVPAAIFDGSANEAELWRISENLDRKELTALERADQIKRWIQLRNEKGAQLAQVSGGRGHRGGISAAATDLGIDRRNIQRSLQIAGLSDEAKTVATRLGLARHQGALIKAAGAGGPVEQIKSLQASARRRQPPSPELVARREKETAAWWQHATDWSNCAAESLYEWLGEDRVRKLLEMIDNIGGAGWVLFMAKLRSLLEE
jgi:ParB/RepB/Spo0J family partition protein